MSFELAFLKEQLAFYQDYLKILEIRNEAKAKLEEQTNDL